MSLQNLLAFVHFPIFWSKLKNFPQSSVFICGRVRSGRNLLVISEARGLFVTLLHSLFIKLFGVCLQCQMLPENVCSFIVYFCLRCSVCVCQPFFSKNKFHSGVTRQGLAFSLGVFKISFIPS